MSDGKRHCAIAPTTDYDFRLPKQRKASGAPLPAQKSSVRVLYPLNFSEEFGDAPSVTPTGCKQQQQQQKQY